VTAVLVHIDLDGERPDPSSLVALAAGRHVASSWGATLYAALVAHDPDERSAPDSTAQVVTAANLPGIAAIQSALARAGADKVVVAITDAKVAPLWGSVGVAWQAVLDHLRPRLVLFGADSPSAAELAPRTGARIGARFLARARAVGVDDVELRDRDGGYVRASDSGAAVAMIGRADRAARGDDDIDLVVLAVPGGSDPKVEIVGIAPAELVHTCGAIVVLADDIVGDKKAVLGAQRLAERLGAHLVGTASAVRAGAIAPNAVIDRSTPLAPELCIAVGAAQIDLAGAASYIKIGAPGGKLVDGALAGLADVGVTSLVKKLGGA
jgi:electron transfer flavoprotein alpha subunit